MRRQENQIIYIKCFSSQRYPSYDFLIQATSHILIGKDLCIHRLNRLASTSKIEKLDKFSNQIYQKSQFGTKISPQTTQIRTY